MFQSLINILNRIQHIEKKDYAEKYLCKRKKKKKGKPFFHIIRLMTIYIYEVAFAII